GCDASILDSTPGSQTVKENPINKPSLRGYKVIDEAKAEFEAQCPQTVSCAGILTFAACDSAYLLGGIKYAVQSGRRDGLVSLIDEPVQNLPAPFFDLQSLHQFFTRKGLSLKELCMLKFKFPNPFDNSSHFGPIKLDNRYYQNVVNRTGLFTSDQMLMASPETAIMVKIIASKGEI
ncbi:Peroxidase 5, partial [Bienertia sinuspersici]